METSAPDPETEVSAAPAQAATIEKLSEPAPHGISGNWR
jgi:hypothetical protein